MSERDADYRKKVNAMQADVRHLAESWSMAAQRTTEAKQRLSTAEHDQERARERFESRLAEMVATARTEGMRLAEAAAAAGAAEPGGTDPKGGPT